MQISLFIFAETQIYFLFNEKVKFLRYLGDILHCQVLRINYKSLYTKLMGYTPQ